jgi:hypothetical protein
MFAKKFFVSPEKNFSRQAPPQNVAKSGKRYDGGGCVLHNLCLDFAGYHTGATNLLRLGRTYPYGRMLQQ